jgi:hypothetical protein
LARGQRSRYSCAGALKLFSSAQEQITPLFKLEPCLTKTVTSHLTLIVRKALPGKLARTTLLGFSMETLSISTRCSTSSLNNPRGTGLVERVVTNRALRLVRRDQSRWREGKKTSLSLQGANEK